MFKLAYFFQEARPLFGDHPDLVWSVRRNDLKLNIAAETEGQTGSLDFKHRVAIMIL